MKKLIMLLISHGFVLGVGFAAGIYALPILIAPSAPDAATVAAVAETSSFQGKFSRERADSDALHWGEGVVSLAADSISFEGALSPGPDYRIYLSPTFVETESAFNALKDQMVQVGPVKTFDNFVVPIAPGVNLEDFGTVIIWCEAFGEFITSAEYSPTEDGI